MPTDIVQQLTSGVGGFFSNPIVVLAFQAIAVYVVVLWLAAAYWAFRDLQARTDNPILPYLAASLVILFTPALFPLGVVVYRIIRPQERIGELNERSLAEEALISEVESVAHCPTCARRINDEWLICPTCRTRLHRVCPNCARLVGLDWSLCAWCGRDFERREAPVVVAPVTAPAARIAPAESVAAAMQMPLPASARIAGEPVQKAGIRAAARKASDPLPER